MNLETRKYPRRVLHRTVHFNLQRIGHTRSSGAKSLNVRLGASSQISLHSAPDDCWVSFLGAVHNLTDVIKVRSSQQMMEVTMYP